MGIYEPAEDSYLLQKHVREYALGRVLDMGTGSGIQALTAVTNPNAQQVIAIDSNPEAVIALQQKVKSEKIRKITVLQSDLFSHVPGQFNLIIFNPPYLPQDQGIEDQAIYGGKKGWEIIETFFKNASAHLFADGKILLLFSSLTNKAKIEEILTDHLLEWREVDAQKIAFEELYVYEISKSALLKELERKGVTQIKYYTHGKRGNIYLGTIDRTLFVKKFIPLKQDLLTVAIKVKRKESQALSSIENEVVWLQRVNPKGIGPQLLFSGENYLVTEFIEGKYILDWIQLNSKETILVLLLDLLKQCFVLDQLEVTKEEMHHPFKHIIITPFNVPVMVDFERCKPTKIAHNVTQFLEFMCRIRNELGAKGINFKVEALRTTGASYKQAPTKEMLDIIINLFHQSIERFE